MSSFLIRLFVLPLLLVFTQTTSLAFNGAKDSVGYYLKESKKHVYTDFEKVDFYLKKASLIAAKSKNRTIIADVLYNYGATYYIIGSYDVAYKKFIEALAIYEEINNETGITKCLIGQGLIQQSIRQDKEAIKLFEEAISRSKQINDLVLLSKSYLNIGISYSELEKYDLAYSNFHKALKLALKIKSAEIEHLSKNKLGYVFYLKNQMDSSTSYYKKVLDDQANPWEKAFAFSGLSEVYLKKQDYKEAEDFGLKGYEMARIVKAKWDIARGAGILAQVYEKENNYQGL